MEKISFDVLWMIFSIVLVFLMQAGFLCLEAGLSRAKNSADVAVKNVANFGISTLIYWMAGFGLMFGTSESGWVGTSHFFVTLRNTDPWLIIFFLFQIMLCGTAAAVVSAAISERMRFGAGLLLTFIFALCIYPVFGHWAWGGIVQGPDGWLARKGFVDFAGSTVIYSAAGWAALAGAMVLGPRMGSPENEAREDKVYSNSMTLAIAGLVLLWIGWMGVNGGNAFGINNKIPTVIINTVLAASSGLLTTVLLGCFNQGYVKPINAIHGSLAGLVSVSAACHALDSLSAVIIGIVAAIVTLGIQEVLEHKDIDGAAGTMSVYLAAGIWGTLAVAFFGQPEILGNDLNRWEQFKVQLLGVLTCGFYAFGVSYFMLKIINRLFFLRVNPESEQRLHTSEHTVEKEAAALVKAIENQPKEDVGWRFPAASLTEIGALARHYNHLLDSLQNTMGKSDIVLRFIKDAVVIFGKDGLLAGYNPAADVMFGISKNQVQERSIFALLNSNMGWKKDGAVVFLESNVVDEVLDEELYLEAYRNDGTIFPIELIITKGHWEGEDLYIGVIRDITKRQQNEMEFYKQKKALELANRDLVTNEKALRTMYNDLKVTNEKLKNIQQQLFQSDRLQIVGKLASGVAHEVKNPLAIITQGVEYITKKLPKDNENITLVLQDVTNAVHRADAVIKGLLDFSSLRQLEMKMININEILEISLFLVKHELDLHLVKVTKELRSDIPLVKVDKNKMEQVFVNLFLNAIDAMPEKSDLSIKTDYRVVTETDAISSHGKDNSFAVGEFAVFVEIEDTGSGIPEEIMQRIFEPFYTTKGRNGTGLGLSIIKNIVELHKGNFTLENRTDAKGTIATVMLKVESE